MRPSPPSTAYASNSLAFTVLQAATFAVAGTGAFLLRFDFKVPSQYQYPFWLALTIWIAIKTLVFQFSGLNHGWWKNTTSHDLYSVARWTLFSCLVSSGAIEMVLRAHFPGSIVVLDGMLTLLFSSLARALVRLLDEHKRPQTEEKKRRILIYGAGNCGALLVREIQSNPAIPYRVCGLIDDDRTRQGTKVCGVPILGTRDDLAEVVEHLDVEEVMIAIPSADGATMISILHACNAAGVAFRKVPSLVDRAVNTEAVKQLRDVAVEDLLGRSPIQLDEATIRSRVNGRTILVTGAAGSIGSELCRQVLRFSPANLVCFDIAETPMFLLQNELRDQFPGMNIHYEIGSIQNRTRVSEVFRQYRPAIVYHAAAYKHVPLMQAHVFEALENNVLGTFNVADAADKFGTEKFVLVSTDKAVCPTNIMGATKRMCELIVLNIHSAKTKYVAVRFGNVLGSNGSVVPIFKSQIAAGGPVTLTHPEMQRFFMTIPEASQLVLQASSLGPGGQIFVLDMGDLIPIQSLANNLILLSGLRPNLDIKLKYIGLRPGEKLYEELTLGDEEALATEHPKIRVLNSDRTLDRALVHIIAEVQNYCAARDQSRAHQIIHRMVPEFVDGCQRPAPSVPEYLGTLTP